MNELGTSPAPGPPAPTSDDSDIPVWLLVVAVVVALALALALAATLVLDREPGGESATTHPERWDKRIRPYVKVVEKQRDLEFMHPVAVRFLPDARFEKGVTSDDKELSREDRRELEHFTGLMRALGLLSGKLDVLDAVDDFRAAGIAAYYSYDDQQITIRGKKLTPAVRATVVHELTHALQDQHFAIGDRTTKLREAAQDGPSTAAASLLSSVIEGDATRVENLYRASLPAKERAALDAGRADDGERFGKRTPDVPEVLVTMLTSPYTLGASMVETVAADGDNAAVDDLFDFTPTHESSLLDPFEVLAGDIDARAIDVPRTGAGEKEVDSGEFGVLTWYLMLAERLPLQDALEAADGWGGGSYVAYRKAGTSCARLTYAGDAPGDNVRMESALERWIAAAPGSPAEVSGNRTLVRLQSCDPGVTAGAGQRMSQEAVDLVATRTYLGIGVLKSGVPAESARCLAGRLVETYPVSSLTDPAFGADDPEVQARVQQLAVGCR